MTQEDKLALLVAVLLIDKPYSDQAVEQNITIAQHIVKRVVEREKEGK